MDFPKRKTTYGRISSGRDGKVPIMKQNNTKHYAYFNNYQQLLDEFKTEKMLDFVAFFPAMVLLDAIVETRKIGMVNYCKL